MAEQVRRDFNRTALSVRCGRAWYTGQRAEKIPPGLVGVVGNDCTSLDLSYNELTSITAVKDYKRLQELILDNNNLRDLRTLPQIPTLTTLSLNNNKISDIYAALKRIQECCPSVVHVSLLGNSGCPDQLTHPTSTDEEDYDRYRLYAIYVLPTSLRFLDSRPVTRREKIDAESRGKYSRTVKLVPELSSKLVSNTIDEFDDILFNVHYTPLPTSTRDPLDHKGAFGRCKYRYSGKNSEGNRFISNNDL
ncbi:leucine-rich melanocyte differentiation-associated protein-like [Colletes gigas]|uniref:leucine-rich melanocyte differentiation-associated protein-like n=1 Tax=Colletes gigas TaxID=935657 RepID=UPI001C9B5DAB|nr:leucine-rich melanocyte differentiation-associated protein-like [Colletes gigas]